MKSAESRLRYSTSISILNNRLTSHVLSFSGGRGAYMLTLFKLELDKLLRAKSFYLSFIMLIVFVVLMLWGIYTYAARKTRGHAVAPVNCTYESKQFFNGV